MAKYACFCLLISILLLHTVVAQKTGVPLTRVGDRFYYYEKTSLRTWFDADRFCRSHGLALVALETNTEAFPLNDALKKQGLTDNTWFWTSGTDLASNGNIYWSQTGQDVFESFIYFATDEPKLANGDCVASQGTQWYMKPCNTVGQFVCEMPTYCWGYATEDIVINGLT